MERDQMMTTDEWNRRERREKNLKREKGQGTEETREETKTGIYKGDKGDTYRHRDKDNRKQEWSLC